MAWTSPRTWISGELVSSSIGNTHWRDNLSYLYDSMGVFSTRVRYDIAISPTISSDQNNWNPSGLATCSRIRLTCSGGNRNVTGITAQPDGTSYKVWLLPGSTELDLQHESGSSLAANQIHTPIAGTVAFLERDSFELLYDGTLAKWIILAVTHTA